MKSEEDIYKEIIEYINGKKHNRPCTLSSIKKQYRTQKIVDLIFSNPDVFNLEVELEHVPIESRTEEILLKFILNNPKRITFLTEDEQTLPILIGFELAKREYEYRSAKVWGIWREKLEYSEKGQKCRNDISAICDKISINMESINSTEDLINIIKQYCNSNKKQLQENEKYECKYDMVDFDTGKRMFILISGMPDSGKTYFSISLANDIKNSFCFDSDILLEKGLIDMPLSSLINENYRVIVFSDLYADKFFSKEELAGANVINILMKPVSIEEMYRNSKRMRHIPFEDYKKYEIDKFNYDGRIENPIIVLNDYTSNTLCKELDKVKEEIAKRLGIELVQKNGENTNSRESKTFVESLKYDLTPQQKEDYNRKVQELNSKTNIGSKTVTDEIRNNK